MKKAGAQNARSQSVAAKGSNSNKVQKRVQGRNEEQEDVDALRKKIQLKTDDLMKDQGDLKRQRIQFRNKKVTKRMIKEIEKMTPTDLADEDIEFEMPSILAVSATAYNGFHSGNVANRVGFKNEGETGIPALRKWCSHAVLPHRHRHARTMLADLYVLYSSVFTWCDVQHRSKRLNFTTEWVMEEIGADFITKLKEQGEHFRKSLMDEADGLDPFDLINGRKCRRACLRRAMYEVENWILKWPEEKTKDKRDVKMAGVTHAALIRRKGAKFTSKGEDKITYSWMENM